MFSVLSFIRRNAPPLASHFKLAALMFAICCAAVPAHAATLTVTSLVDDGSPGCFRSTVIAATAGDTIDFGVTGTITLSSEITLDKNLTIQGPGAGSLNLSGNDTGRVLRIQGSTVHVSSLTLSHGSAPTGFGGAIVVDGGALYLDSCRICDSQADSGGGIWSNSTVHATNCTFKNNTAQNDGGSYFSFNALPSSMTGCTFKNNQSNEGHGAALVTGGSNFTLRDSTVSRNSGLNIVDVGAGTTLIVNCTIASNDGIGLVGENGASLTLSSSTITDNNTDQSVGGMYWRDGTVTIGNCILAGNSGAVINDAYGAVTSAGHNLVGEADFVTGFTDPTDQTGTYADPLDPKLCPLRQNGGGSFTCALVSGSPAIDAGDDAVLADPLNLLYDQRGLGFSRKHGTHVDIGAFETNIGSPAADAKCVTMFAGHPATVTFSATDPDGDAPTYTIRTGPQHGSLGEIDGDKVVYTPEAGFAGTDSFCYAASDINGQGSAKVTLIVKNGVSVADAEISEGNTSRKDLTFTVSLGAISSKIIKVNYATAGGLALSGNDFTAVHGVLTFAAGEQTKTFNVPILGDTNFELDETFPLTLTAPVNIALDRATATGTILNDDSIGALGGKIAFSTGRDGNYEIYVMNADGTHQTNLTHSPITDNSPSWQPNGRRIVWTYDTGNGTEIWAMNGDGTSPATLAGGGPSRLQPDYSPDGSKVVFSAFGDSDYDIYIMNADGSDVHRIVHNELGDFYPRWSPDGKRILYSTFDFNATANALLPNVYVVDADGCHNTRLTNTDGATSSRNADWSPDGTKIVFQSDRADTGAGEQIYIADADGSNAVQLTAASGGNGDASFSPDGSHIVFTSGRNGAEDIYVMDANGDNPTRLTTAGGSTPSWAPGGAPNHVPFAVSRKITVNSGPVPVTLTASDANDDALTYTVLTCPTHGTLSGDAPNLTYTPDDDFTTGDSFTFKASDGAGSSNIATITLVDNIRPTVTVTSPGNGSGIKALLNAGGLVKDNRSIKKVEVTLQRVSDSRFWNGNCWTSSATRLSTTLRGAGTVRGDGSWTKANFPPVGPNVRTQIQEGKYILAATATDGACNTSLPGTPTKTTFFIDTTAPSGITITSPAAGSTVKTLPRITGTAGDDLGVSQVLLALKRSSDGKYWTGTEWGTYTALPATLTGLATQRTWGRSTGLPAGDNLNSGNYVVTAIAVDGAGNRANISQSFKVADAIAPTGTLTSPANASTVSELTQIAGTAHDSGGSGMATVKLALLRLSDSAFWNGTTWSATVADLPVTTTPGVLSLVKPVRDPSILVLPGDPNSVTWTCTAMPSGADLADGVYRAIAVAVDKAGNISRPFQSQFLVKQGKEPSGLVAPQTKASKVMLSSAAATTSGTIELVFTGALGTSATDVLRYSALQNGEPVEVLSAQQKSPSVIVLTTDSLVVGAKIAVSYALQDAAGDAVVGTAKIVVR